MVHAIHTHTPADMHICIYVCVYMTTHDLPTRIPVTTPDFGGRVAADSAEDDVVPLAALMTGLANPAAGFPQSTGHT